MPSPTLHISSSCTSTSDQDGCQQQVLAQPRPELADQNLLLMLLPYLDVPSTCALVNAQPLVLDVLQHKFVWKGLLKRWINDMDRRVDDGEYLEDSKHGDEDLEEVKQLANMLKMMDQPETLLLELLEILCESDEDMI